VTGPKHLILFDGVCGLCHRTIRFVIAHDAAHLFDFAPLDSATGRSFVDRAAPLPDAPDTFYVVPDYRTASVPTLLSKGRAAMYVAKRLDGPWRWLAVGDAVPGVVLDGLYDFVARHRYAVFGRYDTCPVPSPEHRARFLDR
jgi:predicted DCC family thiol-disulfide oxidoreductase YuxK